MRVPWLQLLFWVYLFFLVWAEGTATNPADPDLWHRLAVGEMITQTNHFPTGQTFSYLSDYHRVADHEWGSGVLFYALYEWGGGAAIVGLKLVTLAVTLLLLVWAGTCRHGFNLLFAPFYAVVLLALLPSFQSTTRCMVFTHIFFALWLYWYQLERKGRAVPLGWYVGTIIVWCNLHGGFAIGLAWLFALIFIEGFFSGKAACFRWLRRFAVCTLATLVNPFGWHLWLTTLRALVTPRPGFAEWAPVSWWPEMMTYAGYKLLLLGVAALLMTEWKQRGWKRLDRPAVLFLLGAMALAFTSARHTSLFAAVAGAFVPGLLPAGICFSAIQQPMRRLSLAAVWFALFLIPFYAALIILPGDKLQLRDDAASCPVAAVNYLKENDIHGDLLVPFNYGSYALWQLRGRMRVSMDGRYDLVYRPETYRRVEDFFFARGDWKNLLTPRPDAILLPMGTAVYTRLQAQPEWKEVYREEKRGQGNAVFMPR